VLFLCKASDDSAAKVLGEAGRLELLGGVQPFGFEPALRAQLGFVERRRQPGDLGA
jgi:hypothetical protein